MAMLCLPNKALAFGELKHLASPPTWAREGARSEEGEMAEMIEALLIPLATKSDLCQKRGTGQRTASKVAGDLGEQKPFG